MNILYRLPLIIFGLIILLFPILIFIPVWLLLHPVTFWQKLLMLALGSIGLFPIEILCIIFGTCMIIVGIKNK